MRLKGMARMTKVAIFIPTLGRAEKLQSVYDNVMQSVTRKVNVYFILEKTDSKSIEAVEAIGKDNARFIINTHSPTYAGAMNTAYLNTKEPYFFLAADDLNFHKGWLTIAMKLTKKFPVVGTNDLLNPRVISGFTATHCLVERKYIEKHGGTFDGSFPFMYEYGHARCGTEFLKVAKYHNAFTPCLESIVEHMHWRRTGVQDDTTKKTEAPRRRDRVLYRQRLEEWRKNR